MQKGTFLFTGLGEDHLSKYPLFGSDVMVSSHKAHKSNIQKICILPCKIEIGISTFNMRDLYNFFVIDLEEKGPCKSHT